jgi:DNA-binding response OmpR family regulator
MLRPIEFKLAALLLSEPGRAFGRKEILSKVWGSEDANARSIDVHVRRLREKLGPYSEVIETVHRTGYRSREPRT